jgi:hemolysin activation/secretion protein
VDTAALNELKIETANRAHGRFYWGFMRSNLCAMASLLLLYVSGSALAGDPLPPPDSIINKSHASPAANIAVEGFKFEGNTAITTDRLQAVVKPFVGRNCTPEDLDGVQHAVTQEYVKAGYISSGAVIPPQDAKSGVILIRVVEGKVQAITLKGLSQFGPEFLRAYRDNFLRRRIALGAGSPLNVFTLKERLELIREDPGVQRINAELAPGTAQGLSKLNVDVTESNPFKLAVDFNNRQSAEVGAEKIDVLAGDENLTGINDAVNLRYGVNTGGLTDFRYAGTKDFSAEYDRPVTIYDTLFKISYARSDELIVQAPVNNLKISTEEDYFDIGLDQPVVHRRYDQGQEVKLSLFVDGSFRSSLSKLNGQPFGFSPGTDSGRTHVAAVRFGPELVYRDADRALTLRSTVSVGLIAFGSTENPKDPFTGQDVPDSRFVSWLLQTQYLRRLFHSNIQLLFRSNLQVSNSPLLPVEQFTIGGFDTVRGYRENQIVRDNAATASLELRVPLYEKGGQSLVDIAPFADLGYGWNVNKTGPDTYPLLGSVGVGLLVHPSSQIDARVYYGHPFKYFNKGSNLQDYGINFDILLSLF